jgi:hypothetical protein
VDTSGDGTPPLVPSRLLLNGRLPMPSRRLARLLSILGDRSADKTAGKNALH